MSDETSTAFRFAACLTALAPAILPTATAFGSEPRPPGGAPVAWVRFAEAAEQYADRPYLWLGRMEIRLTIDVAPRPHHALALLWGSKKEGRRRCATAATTASAG